MTECKRRDAGIREKEFECRSCSKKMGWWHRELRTLVPYAHVLEIKHVEEHTSVILECSDCDKTQTIIL